LNANGSYTYVVDNANPTVQALGNDDPLSESFTYTVRDPQGGTDTATLTITITGANDAPVAEGETNAVTEAGVLPNGNTPTAGDPLATGNVLANDTDVENDSLSVSGLAGGSQVLGAFVKAGTYGVLTLNPDGGYGYVLNNLDPDTFGLRQGQSVEEAFTYTVSDGNGGTATATLTITVHGTNDRPYAVALLSDTSGSVR